MLPPFFIGEPMGSISPADYLRVVMQMAKRPNPSSEQPGTQRQRLDALENYKSDVTKVIDRDAAWRTARYLAGEKHCIKKER